MEDKAEEKRTEKETDFSQQVYDTLIDELTEESKIAGVENAYQEGSDCGQLYDEVLKTGWALSKKERKWGYAPGYSADDRPAGKNSKNFVPENVSRRETFCRQRISREIKFARLAKSSRPRYNRGRFKKNGGTFL